MSADALFRAPGIRSARTHPTGSSSQGGLETVNLALFQVNGRTFAVDIRFVREALHPGKITPAQFGGSVLYGHHLTEDRQTPIIRLSEFLQIPLQGGLANPERGLVIGVASSGDQPQADSTVGFLIENVVGTTTVPATEIHPLDRSGMRRAQFYHGVLSTREAGHVLVLIRKPYCKN